MGPSADHPGRVGAEATLYVTPTGLQTPNPPQVFVGAGDIATCSGSGDEATAALLDDIPGTVFVIGDNAYPNGTTSEYTNCYNPNWGRQKARTRPVPGNHEYNTSGASGYFAYFGAAAGTAGQGYYSFDLGQWHIIALNSEITKSASSPQMQWLRADLAAHPNLCTLAYWHEPLYSSIGGSGSGGSVYSSVRPFWDTLYAYGADLVLNGHRHVYERIAPIRPDGTRDAAYGIRTVIAGTGGIGGGTLTNIFGPSEVRDGSTRGVFKLYLYDDSYAWKFVPIAGKTFTDSGSTACHPTPTASGVSASLSTVSISPTTITASTGGSAATVTVTARNASGTPVSGATVTLAATGSGNTVVQPSSTTNASGVATGSVSSTGAGAKTISARIDGIAVTGTATLTVNPASASKLGFDTQPSNTVAGATITPAVTADVLDVFGNLVGAASDAVTMTIGTNPGAGTLGGPTTVSAANGVATFSNLSIDAPGTGYTLVAGASGLTGATSSGFNVTAPPAPVSASRSTVTASPGSVPAGSATTITVTAKDADGNPVSGVAVVLSATGSGNTLVQPAGPTNANGIATGSLSSTVAEDKVVSAVANGTAIIQTATVTVTPVAAGTITHTLLTAGNGTANGKVFTTASIAPLPNTLVTVAVLSHRATGATPSPTLVGGGMPAWTEVASVTFDGLSLPLKRLTVFRAMSSAPGTGPITITFAQNVSNSQWVVSQWAGVETSGTNGAGAIGQTGSSRGDGVDGLSVSLGSFGNAGNAAYGAFGVASKVAAIAPGAGFTEISEQPSGETPASLEAERAVNQPLIDASWTNLDGGALGLEIKAAGSP